MISLARILALSLAGVTAALPLAAGEVRWDLPVGDPGRGRETFRALGCIQCHAVNGAGGQPAPDLVAYAGRAYGPLETARDLWNRGPQMWAAMTAAGRALPDVTPMAMADMFAYLYSERQLGVPGDAGRGRGLFRQKRCGTCHTSTGSWPADSFELSAAFWNHRQSPDGASHPALEFGEVFDLLAWLGKRRNNSGGVAPQTRPTVPAAELFREKGCEACHRGPFSFARRHTRFSVLEVTLAAWGHPPNRAARLSAAEIHAIAGYIAALQFYDEGGDFERGAALYDKKKCHSCHDGIVFRGAITSYTLAAAVWRHGPAMSSEMRKRGIAWPRFRASEMADLVAFLHGAKLRVRPSR